MPTTSAGCRRSDKGVKATTSANRIEAAENWSAIVVGSALSRSAMEWGRMLRSRLSPRSCSIRRSASASSRCRTNVARSPNTTVPAKVTLSATMVLWNHTGSGERPPLASSPTIPETRNTAMNATNQRIPDRAPANTRAPSGEDAPQPDGARRDEATDERHRGGRREQDVEQFDPQEGLGVARAREDRDRRDGDEQIEPGDEACHGAERKVDRAPGQPTHAAALLPTSATDRETRGLGRERPRSASIP